MNNLSAVFETSNENQFHKREEIKKLIIDEMLKNINDQITQDFNQFKKLINK
jgi:hypothetical protein